MCSESSRKQVLTSIFRHSNFVLLFIILKLFTLYRPREDGICFYAYLPLLLRFHENCGQKISFYVKDVVVDFLITDSSILRMSEAERRRVFACCPTVEPIVFNLDKNLMFTFRAHDIGSFLCSVICKTLHQAKTFIEPEIRDDFCFFSFPILMTL